MRKVRTAAAALAVLSVGAASVAQAAEITPEEGPLTRVEISETLNCAVNYLGDREGEFFDDTACGTFLSANGALHGPRSIPAGWALNGSPWTPVSQEQSGSGTSADPFVVTTVVTGGSFKVTQTDSHIAGTQSYQTTMTVTNTGSQAAEAVLYHGADCYLQDDDYGWGEHDSSTGAVLCRAKDAEGNWSSKGRIEQFIPTTAGSSYYYGHFSDVWSKISSQQPLPNQLEGAETRKDNGMALSWNLSLAAGASQTYTMTTTFSPQGLVGLPSQVSVEPVNGQEGHKRWLVTATITNPNDAAATAKQARVSVPENAAYVEGSVQGASAPALEQDADAGKVLVFPDVALAGGGAKSTFTFQVEGDLREGEVVALSGETTQGTPIIRSTTQVPALQTGTPAPSDKPTPAPSPSATPSATPSPSASAAPSAEPSQAPTASAAPVPQPSPTQTTPAAAKPAPKKTGLAATGVPAGLGLLALLSLAGGATAFAIRRRKS